VGQGCFGGGSGGLSSGKEFLPESRYPDAIMDIDSKARFWGRARFGGFCGLSGAVAYIFFKVNQALGLLMLPLVARWAARYIVNTAFDDAPHWIRKWMYRGWHGAYHEFDGRQLRIDDFDQDMRKMPMIAVHDLENLFKDKARFRIKDSIKPTSGLLKGVHAIPADRAAAWARVIARTINPQSDRALKLALFLERRFLEPREKAWRLDNIKAVKPGD
jgi:hypothetical protein